MNKKYKIVTATLLVLTIAVAIGIKDYRCNRLGSNSEIKDFKKVVDIISNDDSTVLELDDGSKFYLMRNDKKLVEKYSLQFEEDIIRDSDENAFINNLDFKDIYIKSGNSNNELVYRSEDRDSNVSFGIRDSSINASYANGKIVITHPNVEGVSQSIYVNKTTGEVYIDYKDGLDELKLSPSGGEELLNISDDVYDILCSNIINELNILYNSDSAYTILSSDSGVTENEPPLEDPSEEGDN